MSTRYYRDHNAKPHRRYFLKIHEYSLTTAKG